MKSGVVYAAIQFMHVCKVWDMIWPSYRFDISLIQNFKKALEVFSLQIEWERSREYLVIILAVKESFEQFSCLQFIFGKSKHREAGFTCKHKLKF